MSKIVKIQCSGFGVSVDNVFNIFYTITGNSTLYPYLTTTQDQIQSIQMIHAYKN
jgi:hypothetical protein